MLAEEGPDAFHRYANAVGIADGGGADNGHHNPHHLPLLVDDRPAAVARIHGGAVEKITPIHLRIPLGDHGASGHLQLHSQERSARVAKHHDIAARPRQPVCQRECRHIQSLALDQRDIGVLKRRDHSGRKLPLVILGIHDHDLRSTVDHMTVGEHVSRGDDKPGAGGDAHHRFWRLLQHPFESILPLLAAPIPRLAGGRHQKEPIGLCDWLEIQFVHGRPVELIEGVSHRVGQAGDVAAAGHRQHRADIVGDRLLPRHEFQRAAKMDRGIVIPTGEHLADGEVVAGEGILRIAPPHRLCKVMHAPHIVVRSQRPDQAHQEIGMEVIRIEPAGGEQFFVGQIVGAQSQQFQAVLDHDVGLLGDLRPFLGRDPGLPQPHPLLFRQTQPIDQPHLGRLFHLWRPLPSGQHHLVALHSFSRRAASHRIRLDRSQHFRTGRRHQSITGKRDVHGICQQRDEEFVEPGSVRLRGHLLWCGQHLFFFVGQIPPLVGEREHWAADGGDASGRLQILFESGDLLEFERVATGQVV